MVNSQAAAAAAVARPRGLIVAGLMCLLAGGAASAEVWAQGRKAKSTQYHTQDSQSGAYQYGYTGPHHAKSESSINGVTRGGYSYIDANGLMQTVSYTADAENGFRVQASNLPNGNSLAPVQDTPEVAVAKKRHLEQLRKADTDSWQEPQSVEQVYLKEDDEPEMPYRATLQAPQYRPRQYRPNQYRRQQSQLLEEQQQQQSPQPYQQQPQQQYQQQLQQQYQQQSQQQYQQQAQPQYQQPRQRARQASNARSSYLLTPEEASEIPAPRPSTANGIVVEAAKPEPVPVPTRFSTASATVHQHHLIVPAMFAVPMPLVHSSMRHTQDTLGQYEYSYTGDTSAKTESRSLDGTTRGAYSYIDANGLLQQVHYIADKDGFRVLATNLPQA